MSKFDQSGMNQRFSNHWLGEDEEHSNYCINVHQMIKTLHCLRLVSFEKNYDISNTTCKSWPLKTSVLNHYQTEGVYTKPIVVTDDDYCLDGRHRIAFYKENKISTLPAYVVPRSQVDKFIESL